MEKKKQSPLHSHLQKEKCEIKPAEYHFFVLANANSFHLMDMENQSEWAEKFFDMLICSAHICHTALMLGITL